MGRGPPIQRVRVRTTLAIILLIGSAFIVTFLDARADGCENTSLGNVPLNDLGPDTYEEEQGGLYPDGSNTRPESHTNAGIAIAKKEAIPRDASGSPDPENGVLVFLSIGMSNAEQAFREFIKLAKDDPEKDPRLVPVNGAKGGVDAGTASDPGDPYWTLVDERLAAQNVTAQQVGVVWLKEVRKFPDNPFPKDAELLEEDLTSIVSILQQRFPHLAMVYLSSRSYAGYASVDLSPEPNAYHSGFAVKWLIERQLSGLLPVGRSTPWLSWGPYLWADGVSPRSDGLVWLCRDFQKDGTHPSQGGEKKVAHLLRDFLVGDPTARIWYTGEESAG